MRPAVSVSTEGKGVRNRTRGGFRRLFPGGTADRSCPPRWRADCRRGMMRRNYARLRYVLYVLLALQAYFISSSLYGLLAPEPEPWVVSFLVLDLSFTLVLCLYLVLYHRTKPTWPRGTGSRHARITASFVFFALEWATLVSGFEKIVSGETSTFMIAVMTVSVLYCAPAATVLVLFGLAFVTFFVQQISLGTPVRLFLMENPSAIGLFVISLTVSRIMYSSYVRQYVSHRRLVLTKNRLLAANRRIKETQVHLIRHERLVSIGQLAAGMAHELNNPIGCLKSNFSALKQMIGAVFPPPDRPDGTGGHADRSVPQHSGSQASAFQAAASLHPGRTPEDSVSRPISPAASLAANPEAFSAELAELYRDMDDGFARIARIVNDMLSFSRMPSHEGFELYDLHEGLDRILNIAKGEYKNVARLEREYGEIPPIECRPGEINQMLLDIITNAVYALRSLGGSPGVIGIRTAHDRDHVVCEISNTGPVIPPEVRQRIFEPFFTTKPPGEGTGLGLSIAYDIVTKRHGGELTLSETEPTTFRIRLPVRRHIAPAVSPANGSSTTRD
jgi:signal transduction histidine kinase